VSLERHETDVAIRLGRLQDVHVVARRLVAVGFGFYGTLGVRRQIENGKEPVFISFDETNSTLPEAVWLMRHFPRARVSFRASNQSAQATAATTGCGLALLPHYVGRTVKGLRICPLVPVPTTRDLWLLTRPQSRNDLSIRTVVDYLCRIFADERKLFEPPGLE
jgi:DNA-binding transcriptional LysR family regulator